MHPSVYCSTIHNNQALETIYISIDEWIKKLWYMYVYTHTCTHTHTHTHTEILLNHKKNKIKPFVAKWMGLEIIILLNEVSKKENKYHMISLIYGI